MANFRTSFGNFLLTLCLATLIISCGDSGGTGETVEHLEITGINPDSGFVGDTVAIEANGMAPKLSDNIVRFNETRATVQSVKQGKLVTTVPEEAATGPVSLAVPGDTVKGPAFTVLMRAPTIVNIRPKQGMPGTEVTISGANFGKTPAENTVAFNDTEASIVNASETEITATVPEEATTGPITLITGGREVTGPKFTVRRNNAPALTGEVSFTVGENQTAVGTITANDPDEDDLTFSISGGADREQFSIESSEGALHFVKAPDFENPGDTNSDNVYEVEVSVSDGTATAGENITITVGDVNENRAPSITSGASFEVAENSTTAGTVTAEDPNGDDLKFSLSGGDDQNLFKIDNGSGELAFISAPDFETPGDANSDNEYEVQLQVSDKTEKAVQDVIVKVTDIDENDPPAIISEAGFRVAENVSAVGRITAFDPNGDDLTYSLSGGDDKVQFSINENSGALRFSAAPDFENPTDANANNTYRVQVQAHDGIASTTQNIMVSVTNTPDEPIVFKGIEINFGSGVEFFAGEPDFIFDSVPENTDLAASEYIAVVAEATDRNFSESDPELSVRLNGPDASFLNVGDGSLIVKPLSSGQKINFRVEFTGDAPDFENPADSGADNTYEVDITLTDDRNGDRFIRRFTVLISDVNE